MWHRLAIQLFCSFSTLPLYALVSQVYTIQFLYLGSPEHNEWIRKNLHPSLSIFLINHYIFVNALVLKAHSGPQGAMWRCLRLLLFVDDGIKSDLILYELLCELHSSK